MCHKKNCRSVVPKMGEKLQPSDRLCSYIIVIRYYSSHWFMSTRVKGAMEKW